MVKSIANGKITTNLPEEETCGGDSDGQPTEIIDDDCFQKVRQLKTSNKPALLLFIVRFTVPNPLSAMMVILVQLFEVVMDTKPSSVSYSERFVCLLHERTVYVNVSLLTQLRACR